MKTAMNPETLAKLVAANNMELDDELRYTPLGLQVDEEDLSNTANLRNFRFDSSTHLLSAPDPD